MNSESKPTSLESVRIIEKGTLFVKGSPGGYWYTKISSRKYEYRSFILGGCGSGDTTASQIAERLLRKEYSTDLVSKVLKELGWSDVLGICENAWTEANSPETRIKELEKELRQLRPFLKFKDKDYQWWREYLYNRLQSQPDFNPDEVSIRRLHQAALFYLGRNARYTEIKNELEKLKESEN
jgi:hypothetical protein